MKIERKLRNQDLNNVDYWKRRRLRTSLFIKETERFLFLGQFRFWKCKQIESYVWLNSFGFKRKLPVFVETTPNIKDIWVSLQKFRTKDYSVSHSRKLNLPYLIWFTFSINFFPITHVFSNWTNYLLLPL